MTKSPLVMFRIVHALDGWPEPFAPVFTHAWASATEVVCPIANVSGAPTLSVIRVVAWAYLIGETHLVASGGATPRRRNVVRAEDVEGRAVHDHGAGVGGIADAGLVVFEAVVEGERVSRYVADFDGLGPDRSRTTQRGG